MLLDSTRVRIGNVEYARDNKSFELTTLRNRHVAFVRDGRAVLKFRGKSGIQHEILIGDKRIVRIVQRCHELPGQHLFQYVADDGSRCPVDSGQVGRCGTAQHGSGVPQVLYQSHRIRWVALRCDP